jgi:hypothetical protein
MPSCRAAASVVVLLSVTSCRLSTRNRGSRRAAASVVCESSHLAVEQDSCTLTVPAKSAAVGLNVGWALGQRFRLFV